MNTLKEFNQSELRAHMEWKNGKWFTSSQDISFPTSEGGMHERLCASVQTVPGNNLGDGRDTSDERISPSLASGNDHTEELTSDFQKTSPVKFIRKRRRHLSDPRNVFSHSPKKLKEGTVLRSNQQKKHDSVIKEMLNESVSPGAEKNVETTGNQSATGDQSSGNPSWGMRTRRNQRNVSSMKNNSAQMSQVDNMEIDVGGKEPDAAEKTADDVQNEQTNQEIVVPVVIGLPCAEMMSPGFGKSKGKRSRGSNNKESVSVVSEEKQHLLDSPIQKIEDMKLTEFGELSEKRKRGRPRKIPTESIETPAADDLNKKADDPTGVPEVEVIDMATSLPIQEKTMLIKETTVFVLSEPKDRKVLTPKRISLRKHEEKVVKESIMLEENPVSKRGRKSPSERIAPQVPDSPVAAGEKTAEVVKSTVEINEVVSETRGIEFENQPLSKWFDGMHTPPSIDDSRVPDVDAVDKRIENGDKQKDSIILLEITEKQQESSIIQSLPFAKNNFLWKTIESMEVFQKIPQNPHFQPLEQFKESSREGKAIGLMVIFSNVVEKICKLRIDDPISVTDDILDTLAELEKHGFTVGGLQARVDKLIDLKLKEEKLVDEVKGLTDEILEHDVEKRKILEEMDELNEQIRKLQEKLSVIESAKVKKEDEIVSLAIRLKETEESIKKARCEFEGIVSTEL